MTRFLDDLFSVFEEWSEGAYSMISRGCDSTSLGKHVTELHKARDFNLAMVNEYNFNESPTSHIPWHHDKMEQSARDEWDFLVKLVMIVSLGDSAIFSVMPNRDSPTFFAKMVVQSGCASKRELLWEKVRLQSKARFAFYLHKGDILLMTGKFQKHFIHKTWERNSNFQDHQVLVQHCRQNNYTFICLSDDNSRARFDLGMHYVITGRHIHYHEDPQCQLQVLPPDQHVAPQLQTRPPMMGYRPDLVRGQQMPPSPCLPPPPPAAWLVWRAGKKRGEAAHRSVSLIVVNMQEPGDTSDGSDHDLLEHAKTSLSDVSITRMEVTGSEGEVEEWPEIPIARHNFLQSRQRHKPTQINKQQNIERTTECKHGRSLYPAQAGEHLEGCEATDGSCTTAGSITSEEVTTKR